jgi:hypothetical protein
MDEPISAWENVDEHETHQPADPQRPAEEAVDADTHQAAKLRESVGRNE